MQKASVRHLSRVDKDDFDIAIAAIALAHGAEVVTSNLAHFKRVDGLTSRHRSE